MVEKKRRLLFVDDEPDIVLTVGKRLEVAGFDVLVARNGKEALEKARTERPDVIIVDLLLPDLPGVKVCAALKQDERFRQIPIILFSSRWDEKEEELLRESLADAHVTKMQGTGTLIKQINALLEKSMARE